MRRFKLTLLFLGLVLLMMVVPAAQASAPTKGSGEFVLLRVLNGVKVTDDGNTKLLVTTTAQFTGDVTGEIIVDITATVHDDGTFNILAITGTFDGSVHGLSGTAVLSVANVNGIGPDGDPCCYTGFIKLKGGSGDLEGYSGKIHISNQPDGKPYTSDSHFH